MKKGDKVHLVPNLTTQETIQHWDDWISFAGEGAWNKQ